MSAAGSPISIATLHRISELIGQVYDCVIEPDKWQRAIDSIRLELNFCYAILAVYPLPLGSVLLSVASGIDLAWLARLPAYGEDIVETWGGNDRILQFPLEEPIVQSHAVSPAVLKKSLFFNEWIQPQGVLDAIAIGIERNSAMVSTLSFGRHRDAGPVTEFELACLRMMAPHLRRALAIGQLLEIKRIEASKFADVLEALAVAIVVVDQDSVIIHANSAAQAMLREGDPIFMRDGQVSMHAASAHSALRRTVAHTVGEQANHEPESGGGIAAPRKNGPPCAIHVLPLKQTELRSALTDRAAAALFIVDSVSPTLFPADVLAPLYGLTPAELRVLELIADGVPLSDVSHKLGIAASTAKSHLLKVFHKTGCRRQSDLIRLTGKLATPAFVGLGPQRGSPDPRPISF